MDLQVYNGDEPLTLQKCRLLMQQNGFDDERELAQHLLSIDNGSLLAKRTPIYDEIAYHCGLPRMVCRKIINSKSFQSVLNELIYEEKWYVAKKMEAAENLVQKTIEGKDVYAISHGIEALNRITGLAKSDVKAPPSLTINIVTDKVESPLDNLEDNKPIEMQEVRKGSFAPKLQDEHVVGELSFKEDAVKREFDPLFSGEDMFSGEDSIKEARLDN